MVRSGCAPHTLNPARTQVNGFIESINRTDGTVSADFNPNGAMTNIAGLINKKGNVCGMMPHPERVSETVLGSGSSDGMLRFESIKKWLK